VVLEDVPAGCTVVGVPGRIVKRVNPNRPQDELDQVHFPDPVKEELTALQYSNAEITNRLIDLEQRMRNFERNRNQD
jgi:serine O-acetyltransferase